jgi:hypothetical protein
MKGATVHLARILSACVLGVLAGIAVAQDPDPPDAPGASADVRQGVLYKPRPIVLPVAQLPAGTDSATVTDVQVADFNRDGRNDIAVAWYATDNESPATNQRTVSIFFGLGGPQFAPPVTINLYIYDPNTPALSIFRKGTSAMAVGDFDGDGDPDLAVLPFFGDELWFIENLGGGQFAPHLAFMLGINTGTFLTPPEAVAADFDGDGRDELAYIVDPIQYPDDAVIHFWDTPNTIANMSRMDWQGFNDPLPMQWTRALTVADFDGDGYPDLAFTRASMPPQESGPAFTVWHALDQATGYFQVWTEIPSVLCSDIVAVRPNPSCRPGVILTDLNGTLTQYWAASCSGPLDFTLATQVTGYAGLSPNRGMSAILADVDGNGVMDLITKQRLGRPIDANQIEVTMCSNGGANWWRVTPTPFDTTGFQTQLNNQILRPRNLAAGDLFGNTLPEIVAGFAASGSTLSVAIWPASCLGDVDHDGGTTYADLTASEAAFGACRPAPLFNVEADLDKDGCVGRNDVKLLVYDYECNCWGTSGHVAADMNCDGTFDMNDLTPFVVALSSRAAYEASYPNCHWLWADINQDGSVNVGDVNPFVVLLGLLVSPSDSVADLLADMGVGE